MGFFNFFSTATKESKILLGPKVVIMYGAPEKGHGRAGFDECWGIRMHLYKISQKVIAITFLVLKQCPSGSVAGSYKDTKVAYTHHGTLLSCIFVWSSHIEIINQFLALDTAEGYSA